jgi:hypothetical protein
MIFEAAGGLDENTHAAISPAAFICAARRHHLGGLR